MSEESGLQRFGNGMKRGLSEKDFSAIRMRVLGKTSGEIAQALGMNESSVRRLFMQGGRLQEPYQKALSQAQQSGDDVLTSLFEKAKQEADNALENIKKMANDGTHSPVSYKANEYLLNVAGVKESTSLRGFFENKTYEQALRVMNDLFQSLYGRTPQAVVVMNDITVTKPDGTKIPLKFNIGEPLKEDGAEGGQE
ncbi:MAG: hypothetical protein A2Z83_06355 [Omnitrophica bacterium GWA2_52_8]|nr:MAG: hypothetical protein A2Z83_06355 [Omnitrophica bacterium GWA2_52_8]